IRRGPRGERGLNSVVGRSIKKKIAFILRNTALENEAQPQNLTTPPNKVTTSKSFGVFLVFFSSRRRHTRFKCDWSSDVCSSDLGIDSSALVGLMSKLSSKPVKTF